MLSGVNWILNIQKRILTGQGYITLRLNNIVHPPPGYETIDTSLFISSARFLILISPFPNLVDSMSNPIPSSSIETENKVASLLNLIFNADALLYLTALFIASTASLLNLQLVTTDHDFDHLHEVFLSVRRIELKDIWKRIK